MCGVVGFSGFNDPELLRRMSAAVCHRGPDDHAAWESDGAGVSLAHRRLSIIDTSSRGRQPLWDVSRQVVASFNGEIFNYRELRAFHLADGRRFASDTDTEVILNLWLDRGPSALDLLEGMYALALWDSRANRLYLARDPGGIKPLYWTRSSRGLAFASEVKALLQDPGVSRQLNPTAVANHLVYLWSPGTDTAIKGIQKLEPGTWIAIENGSVVGRGLITRPGAGYARHAPTSESIRAALSGAVHRQLVADVPVGAFLSGGVDSTSIVALAREHDVDLACFSIAGDSEELAAEGFGDDLEFARLSARSLGVSLHVAEAPHPTGSDIDFMLFHLDEPQADLAPLSVYHVSALARSLGVKVLLSGAGGDDLFGGYRRHAAARLGRYWAHVPTFIRRGLASGSTRLPTSHRTTRRVRKALSGAHLQGDEALITYLHWLPRGRSLELLAPDFAASIDVASLDAAAEAVLDNLPASSSDVRRLLALDERLFLIDHNLNYTDKMSMAAGVEVRVPFLDAGVVETAYGLSDDQLVRGTVTKHALKESMRGLVPDAVLRRPKVGFGVPLRSWIQGPLAPWIEGLLDPRVLEARGVFNSAAVARLVIDDRAGRIDAAYTILALASLERWMQIFIDDTPRADMFRPPSVAAWSQQP